MVGVKRYTIEELKEHKKIYIMKNKDKKAADDKRYREKHREELLIKKKEYREKNKKRILNIAKEYYKQNKKRVDKYKKRHHQEVKHKLRIYKCVLCGEPSLNKYCSLKCFGIGTSGINSVHWTGGPKDYPIEWTMDFKKTIRKRDAYLCMMCDRHQDEFNRSHHVHHIDGDKMNTTKENCITLCGRHHAIVENSGKKYTFWMPRFRKLLIKLYGYKYGGKL